MNSSLSTSGAMNMFLTQNVIPSWREADVTACVLRQAKGFVD